MNELYFWGITRIVELVINRRRYEVDESEVYYE